MNLLQFLCEENEMTHQRWMQSFMLLNHPLFKDIFKYDYFLHQKLLFCIPAQKSNILVQLPNDQLLTHCEDNIQIWDLKSQDCTLNVSMKGYGKMVTDNQMLIHNHGSLKIFNIHI